MSDDHIAKLTARKSHGQGGCVTKHEDKLTKSDCSYRGQSVTEMKAGTSKKGRVKKELYHWDFTVAANKDRLPQVVSEIKLGSAADSAKIKRKDPRKNRDAWHFDKGKNFKNAYTPYNHNHHHIMPWTSLSSNLGLTELGLLQDAKYNLNDKHNMILLPCHLKYGIALKLPDHPYGHPDYNDNSDDIMDQLKEAVKEGKGAHKITSTNADEFKKKLVDWQERQFDKIVDFGEKIAAKFEAGLSVPPNQVNGCPMAPAGKK